MKHPDFDDVGDAIREDRPLREAAAYRIRFGLEGLTFRHIDVPDPVPTGRQILASAGLDHRADYILFAYLDTGDFEDVRLDETFDLRSKGAERFIAFKSDRDFKFSLNHCELAWGHAHMLGSVLYDLADAAQDEAVFLEVRGGEDRLIDPDERINLDAPGIERKVRGNVGFRHRCVKVTDQAQVRPVLPGHIGKTQRQHRLMQGIHPLQQGWRRRARHQYQHPGAVPGLQLVEPDPQRLTGHAYPSGRGVNTG